MSPMRMRAGEEPGGRRLVPAHPDLTFVLLLNWLISFPFSSKWTGKGQILQRQTDMGKDHPRWGVRVRTGGETLHFLRDEVLSQRRTQEGGLPAS